MKELHVYISNTKIGNQNINEYCQYYQAASPYSVDTAD